MSHPTPVTAPVALLLVTGMPGSGKTALLQGWLNRERHRPPGSGSVMSDFGPMGIDSLLVAQPAVLRRDGPPIKTPCSN